MEDDEQKTYLNRFYLFVPYTRTVFRIVSSSYLKYTSTTHKVATTPSGPMNQSLFIYHSTLTLAMFKYFFHHHRHHHNVAYSYMHINWKFTITAITWQQQQFTTNVGITYKISLHIGYKYPNTYLYM